jgi:hypothetical protein
MSSFAQLEADLFLAERAFKRVSSDQNKEALAKVKKAFELLGEAKDTIESEKPAVSKKPAAPKAPVQLRLQPQKKNKPPRLPTIQKKTRIGRLSRS